MDLEGEHMQAPRALFVGLTAVLASGVSGCGSDANPGQDGTEGKDAADERGTDTADFGTDPFGVADAGLDSGSDATADAGPPDVPAIDYGPDGWAAFYGGRCPLDSWVGSFEMKRLLNYDGTEVQAQVRGWIFSIPQPQAVFFPAAQDGACTVMESENPECDPGCNTTSETCSIDDECVPAPEPLSAGDVVLSGLTIPVTAPHKGASGYFFTEFDGAEPFAAGADIELAAKGGDVPAFKLQGEGVAPIEPVGDYWTISKGQPVTFEWKPADGPGLILAKIDFSQHADLPVYVECVTEDVGSVTVSAALVDKVLSYGLKPSTAAIKLEIRRFTTDSALVGPGCIDFMVSSVALTGKIELVL